MTLSPDTTFRTLTRTLPILVKRHVVDLLYMICEGKIIGQIPEDLDKTLSMVGLVEQRCTIHMIFKIPDDTYRYTYNDLLANHHVRHYPSSRTSFTTALMLQDVLQGLYDVTVHLEPHQVGQVTHPGLANEEQCSVCQDQLENDVLIINDCGHGFHRTCITDWLTTFSVLCPMCNYDVRDGLRT
jgi:hypothetical protein